MTSIDWTLDEGWEDDLVDFLGGITIAETSKETIVEDNINIDIFLDGLAKLVSCIDVTGVTDAQVDLVTEPDQLSATCLSDDRVSLRYGDQHIQINSLANFQLVLKQSILDFFSVLPLNAHSDALDSLKDFIGS